MTILEALDEIFDSISAPQNIAKKIALAKSRVGKLEEKNIKLESDVVNLKAALCKSEVRYEELQESHKLELAELLKPEQGISKPRREVIMGRRPRG
jgi:hypothetical protein